jgi:hypothetical protein
VCRSWLLPEVPLSCDFFPYLAKGLDMRSVMGIGLGLNSHGKVKQEDLEHLSRSFDVTVC